MITPKLTLYKLMQLMLTGFIFLILGTATIISPVVAATYIDLEEYSDPDYNNIIEINNGDLIDFNGEQRETKSVTVSGFHLVIAEGHKNGLWEKFHNIKNLRDLTLHASIITISGPIQLPQTELNIFANELRFEDFEGEEESSINTQTNEFSFVQAASRQAGRDGYPAGDVFLNIASIITDNPDIQRFYVTGGQGQQGGNGVNGSNGAATTYFVGKASKTLIGSYTFSASDQVSYVSWPSGGFLQSSKTWGDKNVRPKNGGNASAPGVSGAGGDSGDIYAPGLINWKNISNQLRGGTGGISAPTVIGGKPGGPAYHVSCTNTKCTVSDSFFGNNGNDASGQSGATGVTGEHFIIDNLYAWLSTDVAGKSLDVAEEHFIKEDYQNADELLKDLINSIGSYRDSGFWEFLDPYIDIELARERREERQNELPDILDDSTNLQKRVQTNLGITSNLPLLPVTTTYGSKTQTKIFAAAQYNNGHYSYEFSGNDLINVNADILVSAEHENNRSDIFVVSFYNGQWYMKDGNNNWQIWDVKISSLIPNETRTLSKLNSINIVQGLKGFIGDHNVFVGHTSSDGNIHFNSQALRFIVK